MGLFNRKRKTEESKSALRQKREESSPQSDSTSARAWTRNNVALELLARFYQGADPWKFIGKDHWSDVLGEKVERVLERFREQGILVQAPVAVKLLQRYSAEDLRYYLKESGLAQEGEREELVRRLITEDAAKAQRLASEINVLILPDDTRRHVVRYVRAERERREVAERKCLTGLLQREYLRAAATVSEYQRDSVFSRGVGIAQEDDDMSANVAVLQLLFESTPKLLHAIDAEKLERLRAPAGMAFLWGKDSAAQWIQADFTRDTPLAPEVVSAMLLTHARYLYDREEYRRRMDSAYEIWCTHDRHSCSSCKSLHGKQYRLESLPELPHTDCVSSKGCRCRIVVSDTGF